MFYPRIDNYYNTFNLILYHYLYVFQMTILSEIENLLKAKM